MVPYYTMLAALLWVPLQSSDGEASLAFDRLCATIQKISTMQCKVAYKEYQGKDVLTADNQAMYYRKNNIYRIIENSNIYVEKQKQSSDIDMMFDGKIVKNISKTGNAVIGGIRLPSKPTGAKCDAFRNMLFSIYSPRYSTYLSIQDFKSMYQVKSLVERRDANNRAVVEVTGSCVIDELELVYTLQFDVDWNYIITSMIADCKLDDGKKVRHQFKVTDVTEAIPGVFVPTAIHRESHVDQKLRWWAETVVTGIRVNQSLPDGALNFRFPSGIEVYDGISFTRYQVDSDGNKISAETPFTGGGSISGNVPVNASPVQRVSKTASVSEDVSYWHYLPYLFIAISLVSLGYWYRLRSHSQG